MHQFKFPSFKIKIILILSLFNFIFVYSDPLTKAASSFQYKLFKNSENFGILIFPSPGSHTLKEYIQSLKFKYINSGKAVFRQGMKNENGTYMMPESIQKKYQIKKFIIIQVLNEHEFMIGIFDPEWGLTLPRPRYTFDELQKNVPKTLRIFRGIKTPMAET